MNSLSSRSHRRRATTAVLRRDPALPAAKFVRAWENPEPQVHLVFDAWAKPAGQGSVDDVFERELDIRPERGLVVFVGADPEHAERLRNFALSLVSADTEMWFTSLDQIFETIPRRRRDGSLRQSATGGHVLLEKPIAPAQFCDRDILVNLDGKRGRLVV